nr:MAG TPA: hypothetical protein [Caudoviricetes sp.]
MRKILARWSTNNQIWRIFFYCNNCIFSIRQILFKYWMCEI